MTGPDRDTCRWMRDNMPDFRPIGAPMTFDEHGGASIPDLPMGAWGGSLLLRLSREVLGDTRCRCGVRAETKRGPKVMEWLVVIPGSHGGQSAEHQSPYLGVACARALEDWLSRTPLSIRNTTLRAGREALLARRRAVLQAIKGATP